MSTDDQRDTAPPPEEAAANRVEARISTYLLTWRSVRAAGVVLFFVVLHVMFAWSLAQEGTWWYAATLPVTFLGVYLVMLGSALAARARDVTLATGVAMSHRGSLCQGLGLLSVLLGAVGPLWWSGR